MQNAPTATRFFAALSTAGETCVFERTPRIVASPIFPSSSGSSSAALCDSTSYPASRNPCTATALMFSSNSTFKHPPQTFGSNKNYLKEAGGPFLEMQDKKCSRRNTSAVCKKCSRRNTTMYINVCTLTYNNRQLHQILHITSCRHFGRRPPGTKKCPSEQLKTSIPSLSPGARGLRPNELFTPRH